MIRVLIAESAVLVREALVEALRREGDFEIVATARTGAEAVALTRRLRPDLVAMAINLPVLDGFEATKEIMIETPTPIVLVTNDPGTREVEVSVLALRAGALAVVPAPGKAARGRPQPGRREFIHMLRAMAEVKVVRRWRARVQATPEASVPTRELRDETPPRVVAIAASTGGPAALQRILCDLPADFSTPILIVQHIADGFVDGVVSWLNTVCSFKVKVAVDNDQLALHTAYVAGDNCHLGMRDRARIRLSDSPPIGGFRPSANFLFESVAEKFGSAAVGVILTGMGQDGVEGLRALRKAGGRIIAQDEASSVVFGMPRVAIEAGLAHHVLPLNSIGSALTALADAPQEKDG